MSRGRLRRNVVILVIMEGSYSKQLSDQVAAAVVILVIMEITYSYLKEENHESGF